MSPERVQVVTQTVRVHRLDIGSSKREALYGDVEYTLKLKSKVSHLSFEVPPQARVTSVYVDGNKVESAYDSSAAEQLAARIQSFIYIDKRESNEWIPSHEVYATMLAKRRDLLSLMSAREILKSTPEAALILFLPRSAENRLFRILITFTSYEPPQIQNSLFLAIDGSPWFPRLGHCMAKSSVQIALSALPKSHQVLATGKVSSRAEPGWAVFDSVGRLPLSSIGLIIAPLASLACPQTGIILSSLPDDFAALTELLNQWPKCFSEILQVVKHYLTDLPFLSVAFLPFPALPRICGDLIIVGNDLLTSDPHSLVFHVLESLADAIFGSALQQLLPPMVPWLAAGLRQCLAGRLVDAKLGANEQKKRFIAKRNLFHAAVESGKDWLPLAKEPVSVKSELFELKSGLVMEALRVGYLGSQDFKHMLTTLVDRRDGNDESLITTDGFWEIGLELTGKDTDRGARLAVFKEEFVESVGCPLFQVSTIFSDRRNLTIKVTQQPLQPGQHRLHAPNDVRMACACARDLTNKTDAGFEPLPHNLPSSHVKRRIWEGTMDIVVFRAPHCPMPLTVELRISNEPATVSVSMAQATARKHEIVRPRQTRNDELVHGWVCVEDDKWLLAKIDVYQGTIMWTNQLQFSRDVMLEDAACEALRHVKGSQWAIEVLADGVKNSYYAYGTRVAAAEALAHMFGFAGERDSVKLLFNHYLLGEIKEATRALVKPQDVELFRKVFHEMCHMVQSGPRADRRLSKEFSDVVAEMLVRFRSLKSIKKMDERIFHTLSASVIAISSVKDTAAGNLEISSLVKADFYGPPISSKFCQASFAALEAVSEICLVSHTSVLSATEATDILNTVQRSGYHLGLITIASRVFFLVKFSTDPVAWIDWLINASIAPVVLVEGWTTLRIFLSKQKSNRGALENQDACDKLWKYLTVTIPGMSDAQVSEVLHAVVFELYRSLYGSKVPKILEGLEGLVQVDKELEKVSKQNITRGKYWQPEIPKISEDVQVNRRIQIGKIVRKFDEE